MYLVLVTFAFNKITKLNKGGTVNCVFNLFKCLSACLGGKREEEENRMKKGENNGNEKLFLKSHRFFLFAVGFLRSKSKLYLIKAPYFRFISI